MKCPNVGGVVLATSPNAELVKVRKAFTGELLATLADEIINGAEYSADELVALRADGETVGYFINDKQRDTVKVVVPVSAGEVMAEVMVTKGGHTGALADSFLTVFFSYRIGEGDWHKGHNTDEQVTLSCGCVVKPKGYYGRSADWSASNVASFVLTYLGGEGAEMLFEACAGGKAFADRLGADPRVSAWSHADSRPENAHWVNAGEAKGGKALF